MSYKHLFANDQPWSSIGDKPNLDQPFKHLSMLMTKTHLDHWTKSVRLWPCWSWTASLMKIGFWSAGINHQQESTISQQLNQPSNQQFTMNYLLSIINCMRFLGQSASTNVHNVPWVSGPTGETRAARLVQVLESIALTKAWQPPVVTRPWPGEVSQRSPRDGFRVMKSWLIWLWVNIN